MRIIVAGAGHGGLVAASKLAKAGYDVTVYEKEKRECLGHDWEDRFTFDLLLKAVEKAELPSGSWRYRGDCAFLSPSYGTSVVINYTDETRQKIMWRKPLINMLLSYAEECGVKLQFETEVTAPVISKDTVTGIKTANGDIAADLVIDAAGVFSPIRTGLPESFGIEKSPARGDVFYAYRAYFNRLSGFETPKTPFEIYLRHEDEQGLSWVCTNSDSVDILIGRIDPLNEQSLNRHIENFKKAHPFTGEDIIHGGNYGVIPVRRPLALMVARGYAAVGDSAFMTTPMNGMGIDLSINAGLLLAETVIKNGNASVDTLWEYNRQFHALYGGETAKNEGLKNSLLQLPDGGVDFLFERAVIQASDLAGAGRNTSPQTLLGKFVRGMKNPPYFFAILGGIMKGSKTCKLLQNAPTKYDLKEINEWQNKIESTLIKVTR